MGGNQSNTSNSSTGNSNAIEDAEKIGNICQRLKSTSLQKLSISTAIYSELMQLQAAFSDLLVQFKNLELNSFISQNLLQILRQVSQEIFAVSNFTTSLISSCSRKDDCMITSLGNAVKILGLGFNSWRDLLIFVGMETDWQKKASSCFGSLYEARNKSRQPM